jgi:hypothetical protein
MPGDARDLPLSVIDSHLAFVVYSDHLGLIAEKADEDEAMRSLEQHQRRHPKSDAAVFKRSKDAWRIVVGSSPANDKSG